MVINLTQDKFRHISGEVKAVIFTLLVVSLMVLPAFVVHSEIDEVVNIEDEKNEYEMNVDEVLEDENINNMEVIDIKPEMNEKEAVKVSTKFKREKDRI